VSFQNCFGNFPGIFCSSQNWKIRNYHAKTNNRTEYVEQKCLLSSHQSSSHQFRLKHSTTTALLKVTNDILRASEGKLVSLLILLDFSTVWITHNYVPNWLINISAVNFIRSYLSDWTQCVWINQHSLEIFSLTTGEVQGSVLGPLLFSLFINDITLEIQTYRYHLYADDVQLYISCMPSEYATCI
jgi:hypothetical protein